MIGFSSIEGLSTGWMLAGAGAMTLTVALHLWTWRAKRVYFPPAILLTEPRDSAQRRGRRLGDLLMVLLRLLTVFTLAMAFDLPTLSRGKAGAEEHTRREVVILLDRSASMQRIEGGRSLFDRARDQATRLIRSLDGSSTKVGVVVVDADPKPVLPELTRNLSALIDLVQHLAPTNDFGDASAAMLIADSLLSTVDGDDDVGDSRAIIAFTDMQKSQWGGAMNRKIRASIELRDMTRGDSDAMHNSTTPALRHGRSQRVAMISRDIENPEKSARYLAVAVEAVTGRAPTVLTPDEITAGRYDIMIVASAGLLADGALETLRRVVEHGAGLIWVIDSDAAIQSLRTIDAQGWAPAAPLMRRLSKRERVTLNLDTIELVFNAPAGGVYDGVLELLENAAFSAVSPAQISDSALPLLSFSDGDPFIAALPVGLGRVLTVHANLAPPSSDFATSAVFPVFVSALLDRASMPIAKAAGRRESAEHDPAKLPSSSAVIDGDRPFKGASSRGEKPVELWPLLIGAALVLVMMDLLITAGRTSSRGQHTPEAMR